MTDDEARAVIRNGSLGWILWDDERDAPCWDGRSVQLDGCFSSEELLAILHFTPHASDAAEIEALLQRLEAGAMDQGLHAPSYSKNADFWNMVPAAQRCAPNDKAR